jgi:phosphoribosyl-ATP pyrophosphohydrolase
MIPKSGYRFSEKIMRRQKALAAGDAGKALASPDLPDRAEVICQSGAKAMADFTLHDLEKRVRVRAQAPADASYTRKLLDQGVAECAKKLGEEAIETVIAAVGKDRGRLIAETADLIYHLLVVLAARGITLAEVEAELAARTRQSGLQEKASRKGSPGPAPAARKIKTRRRQPKAREQGRAGRDT